MTFTAMQVLVIILALLLLFAVILLLVARRSPRSAADRGVVERVEAMAHRIDELSNLFLVPHTRGGIGETLLAEYLANWLPKAAYRLQYAFSNGTRADAVIHLNNHLVVVDSKFPLESVKRSLDDGTPGPSSEAARAVSRHVDDIAGKYIQPAEGTLHFALMYVPSERVYYHLFVESDSGLLEKAIRRGVVPVSPGNLFLYLQTVAYGLRGFDFPEGRREQVALVAQVAKELAELGEVHRRAAGHLRNFSRAFDDATARLERLERIVGKLGDSDHRSGTSL